MAEATRMGEADVLEKLRRLRPDERMEVIDFMDFLAQRRDRSRKWIEFDEWAMDLAKKKGFHDLTGDDVAEIVCDTRTNG
jgi:hypothetical protein